MQRVSLSLDIAGVSKYLDEKTEVFRSRIPVWRGMLLAKFNKNPDAASSAAMILGRIWQTKMTPAGAIAQALPRRCDGFSRETKYGY